MAKKKKGKVLVSIFIKKVKKKCYNQVEFNRLIHHCIE